MNIFVEIVHIEASFTQECNRSVPTSFQFLEAKVDCSHSNGTIVYQDLFLFTRECNRSSMTVSLVLSTLSSNNNTHACSWGKSLIVPLLDHFCISFTCSHGNRMERLRIVPLLVSLFISSHFVEMNDIEQRLSRAIALHCERDLNVR